MPIVTLDITGFYFSIDVDVPANSTVQDLMRDAATLSKEPGFPGQPKDPQGNPLQKAHFEWTPSKARNGKFLSSITVRHFMKPPTRQLPTHGATEIQDGVTEGVHTYCDEPGSNLGKSGVFWQYYVFEPLADGKFKIVNGIRPDNTRRIVGSGDADNKEYILAEGYRVVWRAVLINLAPSRANDDAGKALAVS